MRYVSKVKQKKIRPRRFAPPGALVELAPAPQRRNYKNAPSKSSDFYAFKAAPPSGDAETAPLHALTGGFSPPGPHRQQ